MPSFWPLCAALWGAGHTSVFHYVMGHCTAQFRYGREMPLGVVYIGPCWQPQGSRNQRKRHRIEIIDVKGV